MLICGSRLGHLISRIILFACMLVITISCTHPVAQAALPAQPSPEVSLTPERNSLSTSVGLSPTSTILLPTDTAVIVATLAESATTATFTPVVETPDSTEGLTRSLPEKINLDPANWKDWPVIPLVTQHARQIYQTGIIKDTDPHSFSVLGDCQSLPETFMGIYDEDISIVKRLPVDLQETVSQFSGSFSRQSPTVKGGTTAGAILWIEWHEGLYGCQMTETPLACELRIHNPSIVLINLGTHYETRNMDYLRKILDILISQGSLPVLSTKADDRELDDRLNYEMAVLASEYNLPLWNFWKAVSDLPNNGVGTKKGEEFLGEIYLSDEGLERQRFTALQVLDTVWRAVR